ncbi:MAG TPA: hypothetical protein VN598_14905 [Usitatibacter sp.]|nr:hypothetical protein [Usitatibacter sp.]
MKDHRIGQETGRVLFAAAVVWATVVAAAAVEGVADKFGDAALQGFGAAMALFAFACYRIDAELRTFARGTALRALTLAALAGPAITLAAFAAHAATFAVFAAPLAGFALAARLDRNAARREATRAPAKSPGARQAAT